ncbi:uncharacterized protein LOC118766814 [Octopus sinensis]|uniref:Uncharacterized protein LOC118766814 n=1 Tax=Octopus sinensis TaxID=2607531 RepID=A0A7E6FGK5_9MOLL|nr:uncharacterized protein LOC118766814 [Octopus sinensis]
MQNDNIIFQSDFDRSEKRFKPVVKRKGFDCTPAKFGPKGEITCWKFVASCEDATHYSCKTNEESSPSKTFEVGSFISKLKLLNPPIEVNKTLIFRCTAFIGVPRNSTYFVWFERTRIRVNAFPRSVSVDQYDHCINVAVSIFNYTLNFRNAGSTTLTCFLDGETLSERLIPPVKIRSENNGIQSYIIVMLI